MNPNDNSRLFIGELIDTENYVLGFNNFSCLRGKLKSIEIYIHLALENICMPLHYTK